MSIHPALHGAVSSSAADQELLFHISRGDDQAFWELWLRYAPALRRVCLHEMGSHAEDAEDALGEAMLKALGKIRCTNVVNARAWLTALTRNVCRDIHRRRSRSAAAARDFSVLADHGGVEETTQPPEIDSRALIDSLPRRLREAVTFRIVDGLPYAEIALRLTVTEAAVRKRVQKARVMLMRALPEEQHRRVPRGASKSHKLAILPSVTIKR